MTYVPQVPPSELDLARARLGDLDTPPLAPDWVYLANLSAYSYNEALARIAESIGASLLKSEGAEVTLGDQKFKTSQNSKYYFDLAASLRENIPDGGDAAFGAGGVGTLSKPCPNVLDGYDPRCDPNCWPYGAVGYLP